LDLETAFINALTIYIDLMIYIPTNTFEATKQFISERTRC